MTNVMLSTIDNPFNPFTQWDQWRRFDEDKKYYTCAYLARIAATSDDLSEADYDQEIKNAIQEIITFNINGLYKKVYEDEAPGEGVI